MKKILLLGTGGTIACKRTPDGLKPVITSEEICAGQPPLLRDRQYTDLKYRQYQYPAFPLAGSIKSY